MKKKKGAESFGTLAMVEALIPGALEAALPRLEPKNRPPVEMQKRKAAKRLVQLPAAE